jgi:hypothetical protein
MAFLFKRVKNITKGLDDSGTDLAEVKTALKEPAEVALIDQLIVRWPEIETGDLRRQIVGGDWHPVAIQRAR